MCLKVRRQEHKRSVSVVNCSTPVVKLLVFCVCERRFYGNKIKRWSVCSVLCTFAPRDVEVCVCSGVGSLVESEMDNTVYKQPLSLVCF